MKKGHFSKAGFILASAGSAVGLGNIWKFPYIAGDNGGGAFVLVYLLTVAFVGIPLLAAEIALGNMTQREPVSAFEHVAPSGKKQWRFAGFSFLGSFTLLTFYSVVIGWLYYYIYLTLFHLPTSIAEAEAAFMGLVTGDAITQIFFHALAMLTVALVVAGGIQKGIERINTFMMPALILIILVMFFYALSFDTFGKAVSFMFDPDFSKLTAYGVLVAVGHAFFTLSIGMAAIMTYASFSGKQTKVLSSSLWITGIDTAIALLAGLMMFTFMYNFGMDPQKGAGLVFISMPAVFYQMGAVGNVFAVLFFVALTFAGLTSAISILEPTVAHLEERRKISRTKAVWGSAAIIYLIGFFALLSQVKGFGFLSVGEKSLFDAIDLLSSSIMLPLGGLTLALFLGWVVDRHNLERFLEGHGFTKVIFNVWFFAIRFVAPVAITTIMLYSLFFGSL